ncbi:Ribonuclease H-like domain containing protein [Russula decolorans]
MLRRGGRECLRRPRMLCTPMAHALEMGSLGPSQALACGGESMTPGMCSPPIMIPSIYACPSGDSNLSERCPGRQTNNRAELIAIIRALETTPITSAPLIIKSDSQYSIKCFTDWLPGWRRHNFTTSKGEPVKNVELIMYMDALISLRDRSGQQVMLQYVRGHVGEVGNEGADALAVRGAKLHEVEELDWDTLRLRLLDEGPEPKRGAIADTELEDANISMYADMLLDENDILAELEEN